MQLSITVLLILTSLQALSQKDIPRMDTLLMKEMERKLWQLDSNQATGYRYILYPKRLEGKEQQVIGLTTQEVTLILGKPDDTAPNTGISPELSPAERRWIYYIYDKRFRVFHQYNLFIKEEKVIAVRFRRGAY